MFVAIVPCGIGLVVDERSLLGAPLWLKPTKFALSLGIYCASLAWVLGYIRDFPRTRKLVSSISVVALSLEMGIISLQALRGTTSHFNVSTPLDGILFSIMGGAIVAQTLASIAVAWALFRQRFREEALGWALRLGMVITLAGAFMGGLMTKPDADQLEQALNGQVATSGAHSVGGSDGGPGIPVTGWSREHGDLRIPHFVALHALQAVPLFALGLRRTRTSDDQRAKLVKIFAASYTALVAIVLIQALLGQSLVAPTRTVVTLMAVWGLATLTFTWHAVRWGLPKPRRVIRAA